MYIFPRDKWEIVKLLLGCKDVSLKRVWLLHALSLYKYESDALVKIKGLWLFSMYPESAVLLRVLIDFLSKTMRFVNSYPLTSDFNPSTIN